MRLLQMHTQAISHTWQWVAANVRVTQQHAVSLRAAVRQKQVPQHTGVANPISLPRQSHGANADLPADITTAQASNPVLPQDPEAATNVRTSLPADNLQQEPVSIADPDVLGDVTAERTRSVGSSEHVTEGERVDSGIPEQPFSQILNAPLDSTIGN
eukprot:6178330-Amphidinium_carterae.1